jgi:2-amino-4-hydroxy-6-hydroxymethyldihydropteridine diphosphokinase
VGEVLDQAPFLNACLKIATDLEPEALLDACKAIEAERGRVLAGEPGYVRHGPRPLDVDLLLLGDEPYRSERLTLPHEQVLARRFVLIPLLELDFGLRTPDGTALADALAALPLLDEGVRRSGDPLKAAG